MTWKRVRKLGLFAFAMLFFVCSRSHGPAGGLVKHKDPSNLDPNYLQKSMFFISPFHWGLRTLRRQCANMEMPPFHVDFHGKHDRDASMDIGTKTMEEIWPEKTFAKIFKATLSAKLVCSFLSRTCIRHQELSLQLAFRENAWKNLDTRSTPTL